MPEAPHPAVVNPSSYFWNANISKYEVRLHREGQRDLLICCTDSKDNAIILTALVASHPNPEKFWLNGHKQMGSH